MRPLLTIGLVCAIVGGCSGARHAPPSTRDGEVDAPGERQDVAADVPAPDAGGPDADGREAQAIADGRDEGPAPDANVACTNATPLDATTPKVHGQLDLAGPPAAACGGGGGGALLYAVEVPAGHRLAVRATATAGAPAWTPRLVAFEACGAATCIAQGSASAGPLQRLDWINNGSAARRIVLAVSADGTTKGAEFDLTVGLTDLFPSCARPIPVQDGTTFVNVSLVNVQPPTNSSCGLKVEPALYYVATLLPQQSLEVSAPVAIGLRSACDDDCSGGSSPKAYTINLSTEPRTVVIELKSQGPLMANAVFDVSFSLPPPPAGVVVTPTSPLVTTEGGGKATFQVVLASRPTASVDFGVASDRPGEGTASPGKLVFDATNWHKPQTVTVTGADDQAGDGAQKYTIVTAPAVSTDLAYAKLDAEDVPLTNLDDEPSVRLEGADDLVTSEDGSSATFTVRLLAAPTATVTVPLSSSDAGEGTVSPASLSFTPQSWNIPQVVTLTGADDAVVDGPQPYTIALGPLASGDTRYGGLKPGTVAAHNRDNDFAQVDLSLGSQECGIAGTPNQFPVAIDALGKIYIVISCSDQLLLFTSANGGVTFSGPISIPGTTAKVTGSFAIAAGRGGTAYLAFSARGKGLQVARTADSGKTWTLQPVMPLEPDLIRIDAVGDTVVIAGTSPLPGGMYEEASVVLRSQDGGRSFPSQTKVPGQMTALAVGSDGKSVWLVDDSGPSLWKSSDGGATFQNAGHIDGPAQECCYVFGTSNVFATWDGEVTVASLTDPTQSKRFTGALGVQRAATLDDAGVVTIFNQSVGERLDGRRFRADGVLGTPRVITDQAYQVGAVALSRHATGIVSLGKDGLRFSVATWP